MPSTANRPTVFVSSTISDFQDLRAALKFWLEESGLEVWLSEYNDMEKDPGANAFEACFASVGRADFYILLIGERRGSLYIRAGVEDVSVTRQEYRTAREAFLADGHPIPILFVRASTEDRLDGWEAAERVGREPFEHAADIARFVAEVKRARETDDAVASLGPYPLANWLHRFNNFRDIIDGLKFPLGLRTDISSKRVLAALQLDLESTLSALVVKGQRKIDRDDVEEAIRKAVPDVDPSMLDAMVAEMLKQYGEMDLDFLSALHSLMTPVVERHRLNPQEQNPREQVPVRLSREDMKDLGVYTLTGLAAPSRIWTGGLKHATANGSLLRYNPQTKAMEDTDLTMAMAELLQVIEGYESQYPAAYQKAMEALAMVMEARQNGRSHLDLPWDHAVHVWGLCHAQAILYRRAASLYAYILGVKDTPWPEVLPTWSPYGTEMETRVRKERATRADIRNFVKAPGFWTR